MNKKIGNVILFLGLFPFLIGAQNIENQAVRLHTGVEFGSEFTVFSKDVSAWNSFIAPHVAYSLTPKLQLSTGIAFVSTQLSGTFIGDENALSMRNQQVFRSYLFAEAEYALSERLRISGEIMYQMPSVDPLNNSQIPLLNYSFSASYMLTPNIEVGVQIRQRNTQYGNPFAYPAQSVYSPNSYMDW